MGRGFVATYDEHGSQGIYQFHLAEETGMLSQVSLFGEIPNSKYLCLWQDYLFSLWDDKTEAGVAVFHQDGRACHRLAFEASGSCYVLATQKAVYACNYSAGTVSKLEFDQNTERLSWIKTYEIQEGAGCHQVIPYGDFLLVPCLHLDSIYVFQEDLSLDHVIPMPKGSGCRHGVLSQEYLYVIGELSNCVYTLDMKTETVVSQVSILPPGQEQEGGGAALRLSEDGKKLYASTRGDLDLCTLLTVEGPTLTVESHFSAAGKHPRDIFLCEPYLLVVNRGSDTLISFRVEENVEEINRVDLPAGVSIQLKGT